MHNHALVDNYLGHATCRRTDPEANINYMTKSLPIGSGKIAKVEQAIAWNTKVPLLPTGPSLQISFGGRGVGRGESGSWFLSM